ncbi:MAG: small basic protein [Planctomycetes bacterium]|nr:small basic protein [Planctomycetota bacterium]MCH8912021.1 small basic protein [Planctomycetota bacterium]MCH8967983.1 small basic protein [Planctomycetota bacterium]
MSIDKSLKTSGALSKHRNVLTRAERIEKLKDEDRWLEDQSPFGLIKVAHRKAKVGGKVKEKPEAAAESEGEKPAEGDAAPEADKK